MLPWFNIWYGPPLWVLQAMRFLGIRRRETERCWTCDQTCKSSDLTWDEDMEPLCRKCKGI